MAMRAQATTHALAELVDEDARAFNGVMDAMRLPRATDVERRARHQALQAAYPARGRGAAGYRAAVAHALELAGVAALKGRPDAASDAGTAALLARAALEGAVLNVLINLRDARRRDVRPRVPHRDRSSARPRPADPRRGRGQMHGRLERPRGDVMSLTTPFARHAAPACAAAAGIRKPRFAF